MKTLIAAVIFASALCLRAAEPVIIPNAASPDGTFSIRLTHDRSKDTDPLDDDAPDVQIVATVSNKVLVAFPFAADPNSDMQPLRTKVRVNWNADGTAVALSFSERFTPTFSFIDYKALSQHRRHSCRLRCRIQFQ